MSQEERLVFRPYSWKAKNIAQEPVDGRGKKPPSKLVFEIGGRTSPLDGEKDPANIICRISGFLYWLYLEVPEKLVKKFSGNSGYGNRLIFFEWLKRRLYPEVPVKIEWIPEQKILDKGRIISCFKVYFESEKPAISKMRWLFNYYESQKDKEMDIDNFGIFTKTDFKVHEDRVDSIIKFRTQLGLDFGGYVSIPKSKLSDSSITTCDYYAEISYKDLKIAEEPDQIIKTKYMMIDIEQYSVRHDSRFPDPDIKENSVFQIGVLVGYLEEDKPRSKYLLTLFDPHDIPDTTIIRLKSEKALLLAYHKLEAKIDPDVITHYNGLKYDLQTIYKRSNLLKITDTVKQACSRLHDEPADINEISWSSKAYGENKYKYIDAGRVQLDVQIEIERNYKLASYALKTVAENFKLPVNKDDIGYRQLFIFYALTEKYLPVANILNDQYGKNTVPKKKRLTIKKDIMKMFPLRYSSNTVKPVRDSLLKWSSASDFLKAIRELFTLSGKYCLQDCEVTRQLIPRLSMWDGFVQLASIQKVPISYVQSKGASVKVVSQIFDECFHRGIAINTPEKKDYVDYQGGFVVPGTPGYYENVICEDFFSLYPTNIISGCLDYINFVEDPENYDPDDLVVWEWETHENCTHSKVKRVKQKKTICGHFKYCFKKIKFDDNGNPINEGVMPALLRKTLAAREEVKFELAVYQVAVNAHLGKLEDPEKDLKFYKANCEKFGIVYNDKVGGLPEDLFLKYQAKVKSLNARQLAIKLGANSVYGGTGFQNGAVPSVPIAATTTYMARTLIGKTIEYSIEEYAVKYEMKLVYGDTDSAMLSVNLPIKEAIDLGIKMAEDRTHDVKCFIMGIPRNYMVKDASGKSWSIRPEKKGGFPRSSISDLSPKDQQIVRRYDYMPTKLAFEKLYSKFLFMTKKRYIADVVNTKGVVISRTNKGNIITRRDNPQWLKKIFKIITDRILDNRPKEELLNIVYDYVSDLWTKQYMAAGMEGKLLPEEFITFVGVKDILGYAKKSNGKFQDAEGNLFDPTDPLTGQINPLDERIVYGKYSQTTLIKKMMSRGTIVPANTRLEYLFIEDPNAVSECEKAEDYMYYRENRVEKGLKIDKLHYLESQFKNAISELISTRYKGEAVIYEDIDEKIKRLYENSPYKSEIDSEISFLEENIPWLKSLGMRYYYSWPKDIISKKVREAKLEGKKPVRLLKDESERIFLWAIYRLKDATEIREIVDIEESDDLEEEVVQSEIRKFEITKKIPVELSNAVMQLISTGIINSRSKLLKTKGRYSSYDAGMGNIRIAMDKEVVTIRKIRDIPAGTFGKIINVIQHGEDKNKYYTYTVKFQKYGILEEVSREYLTTVRYKDAWFIEDMIKYRKDFLRVLDEVRNNNLVLNKVVL